MVSSQLFVLQCTADHPVGLARVLAKLNNTLHLVYCTHATYSAVCAPLSSWYQPVLATEICLRTNICLWTNTNPSVSVEFFRNLKRLRQGERNNLVLDWTTWLLVLSTLGLSVALIPHHLKELGPN